MFDSFRKKVASWFKADEKEKKEKHVEKPSKKSPKKAEKKVEKKTRAVKAKKTSTSVLPTKKSVAVLAEPEVVVESSQVSEELITPEERTALAEDSIVDAPQEKQGFFARLAQKLTTAELAKEDFDSFFDEFELTLLEHNVALEVVDTLRASLEKKLVGMHYKKQEVGEKILEILRSSIEALLQEPPDLLEDIRAKKESRDPYVIVFFGINGSGKTTTIARLAHLLKHAGFSCVLAAGDTFRAASIEQLEHHGKKVGVPVVKQKYLSDPAAVAFDAIQYAKKHHADVVLIDTAGRMHTKANLLREMEKIIRVAQPDLKLFVGEAITGNDLLEQVRAFHESIGIDGLILTKADIDEKAGALLSVSFVTGRPIYYLGVGQAYDDLEPFTKEGVLKNLGLRD